MSLRCAQSYENDGMSPLPSAVPPRPHLSAALAPYNPPPQMNPFYDQQRPAQRENQGVNLMLSLERRMALFTEQLQGAHAYPRTRMGLPSSGG